MKRLFYLICMVTLSSITLAETRAWTLKSGKTLEAEYVSLIGGDISLKTLKGKTIKIPSKEISEDDLHYIELRSPPKLDLAISRTSKQRVFPDSLSDLPSATYNKLSAIIKQKSSRAYNLGLTVEFFVIGEEKTGDKYILLDYVKEDFKLTDGSRSVFELSSRTIELIEFESNGQLRGDVLEGTMIVITDSRNEVIAYRAKQEVWYEHLEKLRELPVGKLFDDNCDRAWPTRPKRFY